MHLPPIPTWDGLHPLIVHFPIALLLVAPLFLLLAAAHRAGSRYWAIAALLLTVMGTVGLYVAFSTGEAAEHAIDRTPELRDAIHEHEELAETTRLLYTILASLLATAVVGLAVFGKRIKKWLPAASYLLLFTLNVPAALYLANTGHEGGMLVYEHEIATHIKASANAAAASEEDDGEEHEHD
jgi:uncharacterized membrane protein